MEVLMNLAMTLFSLFAGWMAIAISMMWGVLRVLR
jgi:D-alanyl-lipoteichoic acid acyltransferase DltB (MBOAT superfamily)